LTALVVGMRFRERIQGDVYRKGLRWVLAALTVLLVLQYFKIL